jgi:hypothetical protein
MRQSRLMSLVEAVANVFVGYGVAVLTQVAVVQLFGLTTTMRENQNGMLERAVGMRTSDTRMPMARAPIGATSFHLI